VAKDIDYLSEIHRRKRKRRFYFSLVAALVIVYFVTVVSAWVILKSPVFSATSIEITGNSTVATDDIRLLLYSRLLAGPWRGLKALLGFRNMLIWPPGFSGADLIFLPPLKSLSIKKDYRNHRVLVAVLERKPEGIWCLQTQTDADGTLTDAEGSLRKSASGCWWFDDEGVVFRKALNTSGSLIRIVHDYSQSKLGLNSKVLGGGFMPSLLSVFRVLESSGLGVKEIRLNDISLQELEVSTYDGPKIYFSLRFPADNDLAVIESLMPKSGFKTLEYIDFRVENRAYYK